MAHLEEALGRFEACLYREPPKTSGSVKDIAALVVSARQELASLIGDLIAASRDDSRLQKNPAFAEQFSARLFDMRQCLGKLQSDWRAVQIAENPQGYQVAAMPVATANRAFVNWAKHELSVLA